MKRFHEKNRELLQEVKKNVINVMRSRVLLVTCATKSSGRTARPHTTRRRPRPERQQLEHSQHLNGWQRVDDCRSVDVRRLRTSSLLSHVVFVEIETSVHSMETLRETLRPPALGGRFDGLFIRSHRFFGGRKPLS
ncbi:hypothetical protein EVAR_37127_1 [Eumeta japonica]|uniref:Uncharacterized protein n=1 Tax=Eumeta variegata TaxID=151549 RepID=A0A4C1XSW6_EUMVA|nr:hypothetical protein EVAR_37127_1 [Eumeta japonica]